MKILLLTDRLDRGGAETHIVTLSAAIKRLGHSLLVVSSGGALKSELLRQGIAHLTLPFDQKTPTSYLFCRASLDALIGSGRFDLIHAHARLPAFLASSLAKKHRIPLICTAHACFSLSRGRRSLSRWGCRTIAVSEDIKQYLIDEYSLAPENISVIPNPIDLSRFPKIKTPPEKTTIAFLSRLDPDCSLGAFLLCRIAERLCRRFEQIKIKIGGGGRSFSKLRALADSVNQRIGFSCIELLGDVSDVSLFLRDASVFVGVSRAAMEASVSGIPVVLCGNEGFGGRLTEENFASFALENFCARGCGAPNEKKLYEELCALLGCNRGTDRVSSLMRELTDSTLCAKRTLLQYTSLRVPDKKPADLLLCGYYGFSNMGDDALLRSAIKRAKDSFGALSVAALTKNGNRDSSRFGIRCIKRSSPTALLGSLASCKYLVFGGGTLLQDSTSLRSLAYYSFLLMLARLFGAHCQLWSNGLGQLRTSLAKVLCLRALSCCESASFRDDASFSLAKSLTKSVNIYKEQDLALDIEPAPDSRADFLLKRIFGRQAPTFLIVAPKLSSSVSEMLDELIRARKAGLELLFVAMHKKQDAPIAKKLCRLCGGRLALGIGYADLLALAKRSSGVYSMRLHALIAAKSAGAPYKAFGSDPKLMGV